MADETFRENQWSKEKQTLGTGEGESPLGAPSSPKIDLRTMASDEKSLKEMGGTEPRPYTPPPDPTFGQMLEKNVINPPSSPSTPLPPPPIPADLTKIKSKGKKSPFGLVIVLVLVVGAAALGYFVIYPNFIKKPVVPAVPVCGNSVCENGEDTSSCPADCQTPPPPANPVCGNSVCETSEDFQNCPADCQALLPPPPPTTEHTSLFKISADATANEGGALPKLPVGSVIEILGPYSKLSEILPESLKTAFSETEYTSFVYMDKNDTSAGGSIFKLKSGADLAAAKQAWMDMAENPQFYLTTFLSASGGGEPKTWQNGQANGVASRYLTFTNPIFAINYGWLGDKVIMTTSYNAFKEAVRRVQ